MKLFKGKSRLAALLIAAATQMSGCSIMSFGESEYSCSGLPDGVRCMSARDVYQLTANGNVPRPTDGQGKVQSNTSEKAENVESRIIEDRYVAPSVPNKPVPIRTPAQVMRLWIAPWEDDVGNLNISSYIYTEIEERRWLYDTAPSRSKVSIQPLQMIKADPEAQETRY